MLYESVVEAVESGRLLSREQFHPLPTIEERDVWDNLDPEVKAYYGGLSESLLSYVPRPLTASLYADFFRTGTRVNYEKAYFERRIRLFGMIVAECIENRGRYLDRIADLMWMICEETTWVIPAHLSQNTVGDGKVHPLPEDKLARSYIDLFAAETGNLLVWAKYLLGDRLNAMPALSERVGKELNERIVDVYAQHPEMGWTGFNEGKKLNNWTPWIYASILPVILFTVDDPARRAALVRLAAKGIDVFLAGYDIDGGCDEGPGYFDKAGASLLDVLEILDDATEGAVNIWGEKLIRNMTAYIMHVQISGEYYVNFADANCRVRPDAMLLRRAAVRMGLDDLRKFAEHLLAEGTSALPYRTGYDSSCRVIRDTVTFRRRDFISVPAPERELSHYFGGTEVACIRQRKDGTGLFLAAKGGNNAESHNHNDVGNYIIYLDGEPFVIDAGVETYSRRTFSPERYDIWTMQSRYHNTAVIGERDQLPGAGCAAEGVTFTDDEDHAELKMDMAPAYGDFSPAESYVRRIEMRRSAGCVTVTDSPVLRSEASIALPVMCAVEPRIAPGEVQLKGAKGLLRIAYDPARFSVTSETVRLTDARLSGAWKQDKLYRLMFLCERPETGEELRLVFMA